MTTIDENKALARRVPEEIATEGKVDLVEEISVDDPVEYGTFGEVRGREAIKGMITQILEIGRASCRERVYCEV